MTTEVEIKAAHDFLDNVAQMNERLAQFDQEYTGAPQRRPLRPRTSSAR